uniref:Uncharacterized protein n=1 Tax=Anguilla anguilla TaxID=7936 RepID=A0A0E9RSQ0_ANGAN
MYYPPLFKRKLSFPPTYFIIKQQRPNKPQSVQTIYYKNSFWLLLNFHFSL